MTIGSDNKSLQILQIILGMILGILLLWFYWPILSSLAFQLSNDEDYSFGLLLPLVSGYIVYLKWPQLRNQLWQPAWKGLAVMALGFVFYVLGQLIGVFYLLSLSFMVILTGLFLLLGGWHIVRLCAFPLILLVLMVPLPAVIIKNLTFPLQMFSSILAANFLHLIGIPVVRLGNVLDLGIRQLQVVAACSGLRYILSLTALGIIYCYFYQRRVWKVVILILSLVPAAIFANALRVAGMAIFPALQEGFWHSFSGWLIFVFCFAFLAGINWILNYLEPPVAAPSSQEGILPGDTPKKSPHPAFTPYLLAALGLVLIAGPMARRISEAPPISLLQSFNQIPDDHWPLARPHQLFG